MQPTMYDAIVPERIPRDALHVASYVNGQWPNYSEAVKLFPRARHTSITVNASQVADVLDVEKGDANPTVAPAWVVKMRSLGLRPIVYCSRSNLSACQAAFHVASVPPPFYWIADWTNVKHLFEGSVATQWSGDPGYDISAVADDFPASLQRKPRRRFVVTFKPSTRK